jgi:hypothetical protein
VVQVRICKIDDGTGAVTATRLPRVAPVRDLLSMGSLVAVCEDYVTFPKGQPNVYALDENLKQVWEAEVRNPNDVYVGFGGLRTRADHLRGIHPSAVVFDVSSSYAAEHLFLACGSWGGITSLLDPANGKVIVEIFTK